VENGVVSGTGGLTKNGAGTLTLAAVNTYSGNSTINGGTVIVNSSASLGAISAGLTINAGTLEVSTGFSTTRAITLGDAASTFQVDPSQTYTVTTAIGGSGSLNKTGSGTMVLGATETYAGGTTVSAGTLQINANDRIPNASAVTVSGGTLDVQTFTDTVAGVTLSSNGSIIGSGAGTLTASSYTLQSGTASAILAGSGTITKNTAGTVTLSGANTMSGAVTVSAGTLTAAASSGSALGSVSGVTVSSSGTLLLGASNQINNTASMTLAGGTFAKGNFNEGTASSVGIGALTLTAAGSRLDFGTGTVGVLTFSSFTPGANTLVIDNWTGTVNTVGSASTDRLIFNSDQASNLSSFQFTGFGAGAAEFALGGGYYEVVPLTPVPEPSTYIGGILALGALGFGQRRRFMRVISQR
jgi:fibronectin-binding autotransporter adhesin